MGYSEKYEKYIHSDEWRKKSRNFRAATGNRCCLFPLKRAECSHHLYYDNLEREWLIRDCVPLSEKAHEIVHQDRFWNFKGNWHTPSKYRPYVSNYLRTIAVLLVALNILTTILIWLMQMIIQIFSKKVKNKQSRGVRNKPILRKKY
jgi:hypothetical protein